jgi:hypothetical protein
VGILAEKESLGDEEILIYAITLINKVGFYIVFMPFLT